MIETSVYAARRNRVAAYLSEKGIAAARFEDFEGMRGRSVSYLSGHPGDAFLVVAADARSVLVPWDVNMARKCAQVDDIIPYTSFGRKATSATLAVLEKLGLRRASKLALSSSTSYLRYIDFVEALEDYDMICEAGGVDEFVMGMRAVKDSGELEIYREASRCTDILMDGIESGIRSGSFASELDLALFIERESRMLGCEGTGFETLAAGPGRSFGIHAVPAYGAGAFATDGMSILDCGLKRGGYTTDITMSFVRGEAGAKRESMIALVREAHDSAIAMCAPGVPTRDIAAMVDGIFQAAGYTMPHALGHGIGLDAHEAPGVNQREENRAVLEPGNIITIEPGLYDPDLGGVRLENDVLITDAGCEVLTHSRIVRL
jgi:Xaa-Pro dipeptidase